MGKAIIRITGTGDNLFNADQIIGKSLIAKKAVKLYRTADDSTKVIYTVPAGSPVGVVYSWIGGNAAPLYWAFYDAQQKPYYAKHEPGMFSVQALEDQGALNVKEQTEEAKKKEAENDGSFLPDIPNPFGGNSKNLKYIGIGLGILGGVSPQSFTSVN